MMKTNRIVVIQCRLSSTRLPGKGLLPLGGKPVLAWVLDSMKKVPADYYYVATDKDSFPLLNEVCKEHDYKCFAGDLNNVLKRFCDLLHTVEADTVIRATADNPFLFYEAAAESAEYFEKLNREHKVCDYLTFSGLPHGSGVEIFSASSLFDAASKTDDLYDKEHVGPSLYNHKENFDCRFIPAPEKYNHPKLRSTIDTYSDYLRAVSVVNYLSKDQIVYEPFTTGQIVQALQSKEVNNPVVFIPSVVKGHGTGHLHRCLSAAIEGEGFVYIPENKTLAEADTIIEDYKKKGLKNCQIITKLPDETYPCVVVTDLMEMTEKESQDFSKQKKVISIDEGSSFTKASDYLLDIIPSYKLDREANVFDSGYIVKPENVRQKRGGEIKKILICIGGEDPAGLTMPSLISLLKIYPDADFTAVVSDSLAAKDRSFGEKVKFVSKIENLREKLFQYDLVVTHYGLTAFEAVYAGCAVIMPATTKLHEKLAQKYNFAYLPMGKITQSSMEGALKSPHLYPELPVSVEKKSLGKYIKQLSSGEKNPCPVCREKNLENDEIVSRNLTRTYRRCSKCSMVYMSFSINGDRDYNKAYFFEDYKKQYGKTYEEDFENIKSQCLRRVDVIKSLQSSEDGKNTLDIGCAYGPFLSAAYDKGLKPFGTDISSDAVDYVNNKLKLSACCQAFPDIDTEKEFGIKEFDVCTMWYVIEHFKDLKSVLEKVSILVAPGGIFAFSTPSGEGVSAKSGKSNFYKISPTDHYSVWEPSKAQKILGRFGFKVVKIVSTGHHPERFPVIKKSGAAKNSLLWKIINFHSHAKNLGDTVEIYCRKIK